MNEIPQPQNDLESVYLRREFVKKVAYTAPLIVTLSIKPAYAQTGSGGNQNGNSQ